MIFNSTLFPIFFIITLLCYYTIPTWKTKKILLLIASLVFYAFFHAPYVLILVFSAVLDFFVAQKIDENSDFRRKIYLAISLLSNLGMLAYFKYANFILENFVNLAGSVGIAYQPIQWGIVLPVGISYYTFQTLSYSIDVYRGNIKPSRSLLDFGFFVAFFPQLVAGPIVRAADFLPQTAQPERARFDLRQFGWGLHLLIIGLFGKIVLADRLTAPIVDAVFAAAQTATFAMSWIGAIAFSGQILFDFAGYSMSAIGVAMCFGFSLPDNFRFPYAAAGFSDFWRRWHISLSSWLRDYLYISLGGNRHGSVRTYINLILTMLIGGLWHGAAWSFVAWGLLHGLYLAVERLAAPLLGSISRATGWVGTLAGIFITYVLVCYAWVFFRAASFSDGLALAGAMSSPSLDITGIAGRDLLMLVVMAAVIGFQNINRNTNLETAWVSFPGTIRAISLAVAIFLILATRGEQRAFIYFQF
jgi:alginate O-acetyltransferase complex protein AlgI